jgi:uncharacterized cupin superfamily protein
MALEPGPLQVLADAFANLGDVMADVAELGFWPTTYVSERSAEAPLHWHDADVTGYVLEGSSYILDAEGVRHELVPGTKLVIPAGAVHAEGEVTDRMVYIVATDRAENLIDVLLPLHDPADSPL